MNIKFLLILSVLIIAFLFGCEEEEEQKDPNTDFIEYQESEGIIGKGGGSVTVSDPNSNINRASVNIPEGALGDKAEISIEEAETPKVFTDDQNSIAIKLFPEGQKFEKPVEIIMPYSESIDPNNLSVWYYSEKDSIHKKMIISEVNTSTKTVKFQTKHFSTYYTSSNKIEYEVKIGKWQDKVAATIYLKDFFKNYYVGSKSIEWLITNYFGISGIAYLRSEFQVYLMEKKFGLGLFDKELSKADMTISTFLYSSGIYNYAFYTGLGVYNGSSNDLIGGGEFMDKEGEKGVSLMSGKPIVFVLDDYQNIDSEAKLYLKIKWLFTAGSEGMSPAYKTAWIETEKERKKDIIKENLPDITIDINYNKVHDAWETFNVPSVKTNDPQSIREKSAILGGGVSDNGNTSVNERGVYYGTSSSPENSGTKVQIGSGTGDFSKKITELSSNTSYYVKAYAINKSGTGYGEEKTFTTSAPLQSDFSANQTTITEGESVQFTEKSTGDPTSWEWDFGDGSSSTSQNPYHTYTDAGTYTVKLTVTNDYGSDAETKTGYITVEEAGSSPVAAFSADQTTITESSSVNFTDESTNNPTSWNWEFGDGSSSTSQNPSHTYNSPGTYTVKLTVSNEHGEDTETKTDYISVGSGNGDDDTEVVEVTNPETGETWMDRNLGASRAATSSTDSEAYGDLYQWGRAADGHEKRTSGTTSTLSDSDTPGHEDFIILAPDYPYDWRSPQNDNLWQGVNGTNNPCPEGYRLPTEAEWEAEHQSWSSDDRAGAFDSPLKLPVAGNRGYSSGSLLNVGSLGRYWSSTVDGTYSRLLYFHSNGAYMYSYYRAYGRSVRCLKDDTSD